MVTITNNARIEILFTILLLLVSTHGAAQSTGWIQTAGPCGGTITALICTNRGTAIAGTRVGAFSKDVAAERWRQGASTPLLWRVRDLGVDSVGTVYATTDSGLYRSLNEGLDWEQLGPTTTDLVTVAFDKSNRIYLGGSGRFYELADSGSAYWRVTSSVAAPTIYSITSAPGGSLYAGTWAGGVFRSTDAGASWSQTNSGLQCLNIHAIATPTARTLFAATTCGLYYSGDSGRTWDLVAGPLVGRDVRRVLFSKNTLYAATYQFGVFSSTDLGSTWKELYQGLENPNVWALAATSNGSIYCGTSEGVQHRSPDHPQWVSDDDGIVATSIQCLATSRSGHLFAGTETGIFRSLDDGASWTDINYLLTNRDIRCLGIDSSGAIWAGAKHGAVFRSTDDGASWIDTKFISDNWVESIAVSPSGTVYVGTSGPGGRVYSTTDSGATWKTVSSEMFVVAMAAADDGLLVVTWENGVYRSSDEGRTWDFVLEVRHLTPIVLAPPSRVLVGYVEWGNMFGSTDNGRHWKECDFGSWVPVYALVSDREGNVLAGTDSGVFEIPHGSERWRQISGIPLGCRVTALTITPDQQSFAGTDGGGVYRRQPISGIPPHQGASLPHSSLTVSPNPGTSVIRLSTHHIPPGYYTLEVYRIDNAEMVIRRRVALTRDDETVALVTAALPSGVYVIRIVGTSLLHSTPLVIVH